MESHDQEKENPHEDLLVKVVKRVDESTRDSFALASLADDATEKILAASKISSRTEESPLTVAEINLSPKNTRSSRKISASGTGKHLKDSSLTDTTSVSDSNGMDVDDGSVQQVASDTLVNTMCISGSEDISKFYSEELGNDESLMYVRINNIDRERRASVYSDLEDGKEVDETKRVISGRRISLSLASKMEAPSEAAVRQMQENYIATSAGKTSSSKDDNESSVIIAKIKTIEDDTSSVYSDFEEGNRLISGGKITASDPESATIARNKQEKAGTNPCGKTSSEDSCVCVRVNTIHPEERASIYSDLEDGEDVDESKRVISGRRISATLESQTEFTHDRSQTSLSTISDRSLIHVRIKELEQNDEKTPFFDDAEDGGEADETMRVISANRISITSDTEFSSVKSGGSRSQTDKNKQLLSEADTDTAPISQISHDSVDIDLDRDMDRPAKETRPVSSTRHATTANIGGTVQPSRLSSEKTLIQVQEFGPSSKSNSGTNRPQDTDTSEDNPKEIETTSAKNNPGSASKENENKTNHGVPSNNPNPKSTVIRRISFGRALQDINCRPSKYQSSIQPDRYKPYPPMRHLPNFSRAPFPHRWGGSDTKDRQPLKGLSCPPYHGFPLDDILTKTAECVKRYYNQQDCALDASNWTGVIHHKVTESK